MNFELLIEVIERLGYWVHEDTDADGEDIYMLANKDGNAGRKWQRDIYAAHADAGGFDWDMNPWFEVLNNQLPDMVTYQIGNSKLKFPVAEERQYIRIIDHRDLSTLEPRIFEETYTGRNPAEAMCRAYIAWYDATHIPDGAA